MEEVIQEYGDPYKKIEDQQLVDIKAEFYSYTPLEFERTPLMEAAKYGHLMICEYLITQQNANVNIKSNDHWTALMYAAFNNHLSVVELFIQHNADIRLQDKNGDHVTYLVARNGNLDIIKMLLSKDPEAANIKGSEGYTPLIIAAKSGHYEICKYLVEDVKVDINSQDQNKKTALHWVAIQNDTKIAELLLKSGAKNLKDQQNKTPSYFVFENDNNVMNKMLKSHFNEYVV